VTGQGLQNVYPYLYDPTDFVPPTDESEGALSLQEQEYIGEVQYIQENDPSFLSGEITQDVVFENPLDTLNENAIDVGTNVVDIDRVSDVPSNGPFAFGVEEHVEATTAEVADEQVSASSTEAVESAAEAVETTEAAPEVVAPAAEASPSTTEATEGDVA
jgi:hypothetical protein